MPATSNHVATHKLGPLGAEPELSEMGQMVQQTVHRFAEEVMRPIGVKLDRMTPEEVIAPVRRQSLGERLRGLPI